MYRFDSPEPRRLLHALVVSSLVGAALLFFVGSLPRVLFPSLLQGASFLLFTLSIYLTARFSLRRFSYALEPNLHVEVEGMAQYDLVITELLGKKRRVVARVAWETIDHGGVVVLERKPKGTAGETYRQLCRERQVLRYYNDPFAPMACYIPVPEEKTVLVIPADDTMTRLLRGEAP